MNLPSFTQVVTIFISILLIAALFGDKPSYYRGKTYYNITDPKNNERLFQLQKKLDELVESVKVNIEHESSELLRADILRLLSIYPTITFGELKPGNPVAFNENKKHIYLCMKNASDNALLYVAIHELAHCATSSYDPVNSNGETVHSAEFLEVVEYLYRIAESKKILDPRSMMNESYCYQPL